MVTATATIRAVSYCRTSGEGQRDNTSIPTQRKTNRRFIKTNKWRFVRHYIDECKSGSKTTGRDEYQQMMRDAANGEFDAIIVADVTRFGRDGHEIIQSTHTLARTFGVHLIDTKGNFDTRDIRRTLTNFIHAGVAEDERLRILTRTVTGRMENAQAGKPWTGSFPIGRAYDAKTGKWYVTDKGKNIAEIISRYMDGESLKTLCKEFGIVHRSKISQWVANSQLAGGYYVTFNQPEIGIDDVKVKVPGMPEIISPRLLAKVRRRLRFNRTHNRTDAKQYRLTGYLHCGVCGRAMSGKTNLYGDTIYRHHGNGCEYENCDFYSVRGEDVEGPILDYLYGAFLDEPAFRAAVNRAMPTDDERQLLSNRQKRATNRLRLYQKKLKRLVNAIEKGADSSLLISRQNELKAEAKRLTRRIAKLDARIANLPDPEEVQVVASSIRLELFTKYRGRDWRTLSTSKIKRFLMHLFGDSDTNSGIFIRNVSHGKLLAEFKGQVEFNHVVLNGCAVSKVALGCCDNFNEVSRSEHEHTKRLLEAELKLNLQQLREKHIQPTYSWFPG